MFAMMAAALRASTSSGDWLDCGSENATEETEEQRMNVEAGGPLHPQEDCITEMNFNHACPGPL